MKLLYLHSVGLNSGKANITSVLFLCDSFSRQGLEVTLAVPQSGVARSKKEIVAFVEDYIGRPFSFDIIEYPKLAMLERFSSIGSYFSIRKIVKKYNPDVCFVRVPLFLDIVLKMGVAAIYESHNYLLHSKYPVLDKYWKRKLIRYAKKDSLKKFITISQALADFWIEAGIRPEKILALHDGFDHFSFDKEIDQSSAITSLGLSHDEKYVVYAGSLYPNRGIETILSLGEQFPQVTFIVLGGPEHQKNHFQNLALKNNIRNIRFVGWISHSKVKTYLFAADVLLMIWSKNVPTIAYCSPLKVFEYMAAGRVIVGHGFPTVKEVLKNGETAHLVSPDSFDDLVDSLSRALKQGPSSPMAKNARNLAFSRYSWDERVKRIIKAIE